MRITSLGTLALLAAAALPLAGCSWGGPQPSIDKLSVPADFTFANTRSVAVKFDASSTLLGASGWAQLEVARPDGKLLYRGPLGTGHPVQVQLAVASKDGSLNATLVTEDGARHSAQVPVAGNSTSYTF